MRALLIILLLPIAAIAQQRERALVDVATGNVLRVLTVPTNTPPAKWLEVVRDDRPPFDEGTQRLVRTNVITSTNLTVAWNIVQLTRDELDERAAEEAARAIRIALEADRRTKRDRVLAAVDTLRQWKVDADATTVTPGNAVATVQQLVNRFGTLSDNMADLLEAQFIR